MGPFVFLDIETTGIDPNLDHIIEIACVKWKDGGIGDRFESLINPHKALPYEITLLTGITDEDVKSAPSFSEIKSQIFEFIGNLSIVGHNIAFDSSFLQTHHAEFKNVEIDTIALARILLRKESSYALEVLMKKYGLETKNSHRAMADVESTVKFFEFLLDGMARLPSEVLSEMREVLMRSEWAGKVVFEGGKRKGGKEERGREEWRNKERRKRFEEEESIWGSDVVQDFLNGEKILLQSAGEIPFKDIKNKSLLIAHVSPRKRDEMLNAAQAADLAATHLKEPSFYLSPLKLQNAISAPIIETEKTTFLLKMIAWNAETKTGDREEITLGYEEYELFETIADTDGNDVFWNKAWSRAEQCSIVLVHHYWLARGLPAELCDGRGLVILEASRLEDSFTYSHKKKFTEFGLRSYFDEKATVIFGLLGIFYEHFVEKDYGGFRGNVILNETVRASIHFKRILEAAQNLPEHEKKTEFLAALSPQPNMLSWLRLIGDELVFLCMPTAIADIFHKVITPFDSVILQSESLGIGGTFGYIREILELDSDWKEISEEFVSESSAATPNIVIPDNFPEPNTEGYFNRCLDLFADIMQKSRGKSLAIMASKKGVQAIYSALLRESQRYNVKLIAIGLSGGRGKSLALFLEHKDSAMLLSTWQIMADISEIEDELETVVFQKIPFDPIDDPIHKLRSSQFEDGFKQYTLARAMMRFRELIAELRRTKVKTCYILDSRIRTREYGRLLGSFSSQ